MLRDSSSLYYDERGSRSLWWYTHQISHGGSNRVTWAQDLRIEKIYWHIPATCTTVAQRRLGFTGHCYHTENYMIYDTLETSTLKKRMKITQLLILTEIHSKKMRTYKKLTRSRDSWRGVVKHISISAPRNYSLFIYKSSEVGEIGNNYTREPYNI